MSRTLNGWTLAVVLAVLAITSESAVLAAGSPSHIRIVDEPIAALIDTGIAGSATFRSIVAQLDAAPLLVFVRCRTRHQDVTSAAGLEFLTNTATFRYVRVFIRCDLPAAVQVPLLGHEFQHALEVAAAPDVIDGPSLRRHYQQIGHRSNADDRTPSFETRAAIEVQRRVTGELSRTPSHTVASVEVPSHVWR